MGGIGGSATTKGGHGGRGCSNGRGGGVRPWWPGLQ
uniref:Uncharacterized protein n=1 Tax=Arundo donax TaxID=35708 RepID=A0A0A8Z7S8_ARUDO